MTPQALEQSDVKNTSACSPLQHLHSYSLTRFYSNGRLGFYHPKWERNHNRRSNPRRSSTTALINLHYKHSQAQGSLIVGNCSTTATNQSHKTKTPAATKPKLHFPFNSRTVQTGKTFQFLVHAFRCHRKNKNLVRASSGHGRRPRDATETSGVSAATAMRNGHLKRVTAWPGFPRNRSFPDRFRRFKGRCKLREAMRSPGPDAGASAPSRAGDLGRGKGCARGCRCATCSSSRRPKRRPGSVSRLHPSTNRRTLAEIRSLVSLRRFSSRRGASRRASSTDPSLASPTEGRVRSSF